MPPRDAKRYRGSGGPSELWSYEDGEGLTVELHKRSFFIGWSAVVPPEQFMQHVNTLASDAVADQVRLLPPPNGRPDYTFSEAVKWVTAAPDSFTFIRVDATNDSFTWETAADRDDKGQYPVAPGEVGIVCSAFRRQWIEKLINETATPHVVADLPDILANTERLAARFLPASE